MQGVVLGGALELDGIDGCPTTVESRAGVADVHRFFLDPVVVAVTVDAAEGDPAQIVSTAAGDLLSVYRDLPTYQRHSRKPPSIPGAAAAVHLEFLWEAVGGQLMRSSAVVAADGHRLAVVHATAPEAHGDAAFETTDGIVRSARFVVTGATELA